MHSFGLTLGWRLRGWGGHRMWFHSWTVDWRGWLGGWSMGLGLGRGRSGHRLWRWRTTRHTRLLITHHIIVTWWSRGSEWWAGGVEASIVISRPNYFDWRSFSFDSAWPTGRSVVIVFLLLPKDENNSNNDSCQRNQAKQCANNCTSYCTTVICSINILNLMHINVKSKWWTLVTHFCFLLVNLQIIMGNVMSCQI